MEKTADQLWESLYWTRDLTRPDHLAKVINTISRKDSNDQDHFVYDSQAAKNAQKLDLTHHDIDRIQQLDKLHITYAHSTSLSRSHTSSSSGRRGFAFGKFRLSGGRDKGSQSGTASTEDTQIGSDSTNHRKTDQNHINVTRINTSNDIQHAFSRADIEKYLSELSEHVHLEGELVRPKPIDVHLIKLSSLRTETKLLSHTVLIHTRSNVHILPLRCLPNKYKRLPVNMTNWSRTLEDRAEELKVTIEKLTKHSIGTTTYI